MDGKNTKTLKQILGKIGEDATCEFLTRKGFKVVERNYLKKWGEIDIIAEKSKKLYFIEVKSVAKEKEYWDKEQRTVDKYRPEDNVHPMKLQRLSRTIQSYLLDKYVPENIDWEFQVATVFVDQTKRLCKVTILEDIIL